MPTTEHERATQHRLTVVVPLRPGAETAARALAAEGPPFDPGELPLERHELLLSPGEAIFVFEARTREALESVLDALDVWTAADTWRDLVAAPPRPATVAYSWRREPHLDAVGLGF
ncbi:MAG TPA: hypothetical protein VF094_04940 [Gaiellaceae bacterium]